MTKRFLWIMVMVSWCNVGFAASKNRFDEYQCKFEDDSGSRLVAIGYDYIIDDHKGATKEKIKISRETDKRIVAGDPDKMEVVFYKRTEKYTINFWGKYTEVLKCVKLN